MYWEARRAEPMYWEARRAEPMSTSDNPPWLAFVGQRNELLAALNALR